MSNSLEVWIEIFLALTHPTNKSFFFLLPSVNCQLSTVKSSF
ncbi:hypothetical protein [Microcoleus sp. CAWBG58]|nr:hypothetical protein [Microcoleus sp. CAWBG58]